MKIIDKLIVNKHLLAPLGVEIIERTRFKKYVCKDCGTKFWKSSISKLYYTTEKKDFFKSKVINCAQTHAEIVKDYEQYKKDFVSTEVEYDFDWVMDNEIDNYDCVGNTVRLSFQEYQLNSSLLKTIEHNDSGQKIIIMWLNDNPHIFIR